MKEKTVLLAYMDKEYMLSDIASKKFPADFNIDTILVHEENDNMVKKFIEVVNCKDCIHCHEVMLTHWCGYWEYITQLYGYCDNGERRGK